MNFHWILSSPFSVTGRELADRHYSRQKPGTPRFVAPGYTVVLETRSHDAVWASRWPLYTQHDWPGAWECPIFRNENPSNLSSTMIREAIAITRYFWGTPPDQGMITFVDKGKVRPKRNPGYCFLKAGFESVGETKSGLLVLQLLRDKIPPPLPI